VVIIGAARQGLALARYFAQHGAEVILNDRRSADQLQPEMQSLSRYAIEWAAGGHPLEILDPKPDLVCVSGGIPLENPLAVAAVANGIPLSNDTQIFMEAVPCKTVGITGSAGKTTTTTLVGRMAQAGFETKIGRVWIGGNMGDPLLNYVDEMQPSDLAILEISSFQSELMRSSPNVAAILNITPNHLDRHKTMENYIAAKSHVVNYQSSDDYAILGRDDPAAWALADRIHSHLFSFGFSPLSAGQDGAYVEDNKFYIRSGGSITRLPIENQIELRGDHNRLNTLAACAIAYTVGLGPESMLAGVTGFHGVRHRLEFVRTWRGAQWYNDSIATAPERTIAAIRSFDAPLILLLGGRDKDLPWDDLGSLIHQRVEHVIIFGEAAQKIQDALGAREAGSKPTSLTRVEKCEQAIQAAARLAQPGFVVLFSPGGTSYDEFKDFEERGERYKQWVLEFSEEMR
jgi:UDP-N-acetylmuramoylalanine--D-glutamate ligase